MLKSALGIAVVAALAVPVPAAVVNGDPGSYLALLATLQPGDTLLLAPGDYSGGLPIWNLRGQPGRTIAVVGPATGTPARFLGRSCCNTVSIGDSSWVEIRSLTIDGQGLAVDAVKAESTATSTDHITLESLTIVNHGADQQIVGINTKCPSWGWIVRGNTIVGAGTGMYFGDSDGSAPFVAGLVEHNFVADTIGYCAQVKHQIGRPALPGMPQQGKTVIRHNLFSKAAGGSTGGNARPNLLVGHWPLSGPGASDLYEIHGNVFYQNPTEALFQAEGNVALYQNLFVNRDGSAIRVQPQNDVPRLVRIFHNTVLARDTGIGVTGGDPGFTQDVVGNAVFAGTPISGGAAVDNLTFVFNAAINYVNAPDDPLGSLDLHPRTGALDGAPIGSGAIDDYTLWSMDFNGNAHDGTRRGAYATSGTNPGWLPSSTCKPVSGESLVAGQGLAQPNPNRVRLFTTLGSPTLVDFLAFGAGAWGVNVAAAAIDGSSGDEIVVGPGPGPIFGPQVRGFAAAGAPLGKVNYYAYGTLKYGVNVGGDGIDGDAYAELVTGPGPGEVFGPHVRGWNVDASTPLPLPGCSYFAYATLKYGVAVATGDVDGDGRAEILTGPGPGPIFGPQVRGWNHDGTGVGVIATINFNAFPTTAYGCLPGAGDVEGDGDAEIVATPGPGPALPARFAGFDHSGAPVTPLPGFDVTPFATLYGGRVGVGDVDGGIGGAGDLLACPGPSPSAAAEVVPFVYLSGALWELPTRLAAFGGAYGATVAAGALSP